MESSVIYTVILCALFSTSVFAERTLILMGGGGEPKNINKTIFDDTLNAMDSYLQSNKWKSIISFNGGHSQTEAIMAMKFNNAQNKSSFTANNFDSIIKTYEKQLKNGSMKAGDQLMLVIDTHGAEKDTSTYAKESTHQIAVGQAPSTLDLNNLTGTKVVSMDSLKTLAALAKEKGVKLAILDFSCHSGNSLALANENTCVISSTGTKHFGYSTFSDNFINKMKAGKSLEDVFLETRKSTTDRSFPMISTDAGKKINNEFYPLITPYLYYYQANPTEDKMVNYLISTANQSAICLRKDQFKNLMDQLESLRAISALNMNKSMPEIAKIKSLISDYKTQQDYFISRLKNWGVAELSREETFHADASYGKVPDRLSINQTWSEMLAADYDKILSDIESTRPVTKDPKKLAQLRASTELYTKVRARQQEILRKYPKLVDYKKRINQQLADSEAASTAAGQIALEERKLYDAMYSNLKDSNKQGSNPCKDFIL